MTYGTMQARIADEMNRTDLTAAIQSAIQSAIRYHSGTRFWWNEARATTADGFGPTVAGTEWYDLPTDFEVFDTLSASVNGDTYLLEQIPADYGEQIQVDAAFHTGQPWKFSIYRGQVRLYPVPNGAFPLILSYVKSLATLSADGDTNAWMTHGEELIRLRAKADLYINYLENPGMAQAMDFAEQRVLGRLKSRTLSRMAGGLRPTSW